MEAPRSSRTGDFPLARGHPLIQGSMEDAAETRRRNVLFVIGIFVLQEDLCVISIFLQVFSDLL